MQPARRRRVPSALNRFFARSNATPLRRGFETLETRKLLCVDHLGTAEPVVEERPDLIGARAPGGEGAEPANIVWTNRGSPTSDTDSFNTRFGAAAETARAVVDAVIVAYERMIGSFNYPVAGATYNLNVNMNGTNSGFGASASMTGSLGGKPRTGSINMGAGSGSTGTGNGWFLDPTPYDHSEFTGTVVNAFSSNAGTSSPALNKGDFYTVFAAELTHCMGLFGNALSGWSSRTTATTVNDTAEGGGTGQFWIFNGPSITHLLSSNNGGPGGQNFNAAIHSAGPITTTINGVTYMGAQDQGNAVYEFGRRYMINNAFSLMFKDAYGYSSIDPALYGTAYSIYSQANQALLVRGGTTASADNISITRVGNVLRVSVDIGNDVGGTGALPGAGDLPAFVSEYDISTITAINLAAGDGDDTITIGSDLGINVSIAGSTGNDTLILQGDSGANAFTYNGTTATAGTTNITSISAIESIVFDGGDGADTLTLTGTTSADTFTLNAASFSGVRVGNYAAIETLLINSLAGSDVVNVNSPSAAVLVDVGATGDTINVNETQAGLPVSLVATAAGTATTTVNINDVAGGSAQFDVPTDLTLGSITLRSGGTLSGAGNLTLAAASTWSGGTMTGAGRTIVGSAATLALSGADEKSLDRALLNNGAATWTGGTIAQGANGRIENHGTFTVTAPASEANLELAAAAGVASPLAFENDGTLVVNGAAGGLTVGVPLRNTGLVTGGGDLTVEAGTLQFSGGTIGGTGALILNAGVTLLADTVAAKSLARSLRGAGALSVIEGTLAVAAGLSSTSAAIVVSALDVASGASLDLTDNAAVIDYAKASPVAAIGALLASGYASGAWTGAGIRSSTAAATSGRTLGYGEASSLFGAFPATFAGASVDSTSVLIRYTIPGDANLDRAVNFDDLLVVAQQYGTSGRTFAQGNFNYDTAGNVDFDDLLIVAQQYGTTMQVAPTTRVTTTRKASAVSALDTI